MQERRNKIRINASLVVSYRLLNTVFKTASRSKNISVTGICLPFPQRLEPGRFLDLEIQLLDFSDPIKITGKVIWIKAISSAEFPFQVGIEFVTINPVDQDKLFKHIFKEGTPGIEMLP
ncbi:MAG: PilZ domain-containing protein [Candidatus Omnitrophota bacterium]|jgi:c-di-GMP-binding flagellar brake protein YcgR